MTKGCVKSVFLHTFDSTGFEATELLRSAGESYSRRSGIKHKRFPTTPPSWPSHIPVTSLLLVFATVFDSSLDMLQHRAHSKGII